MKNYSLEKKTPPLTFHVNDKSAVHGLEDARRWPQNAAIKRGEKCYRAPYIQPVLLLLPAAVRKPHRKV